MTIDLLKTVILPHLLMCAKGEKARVAFYIGSDESYTATIDLKTGDVVHEVRHDAHIAIAMKEHVLEDLLSGRYAARDLLPQMVIVSRASSLERFAKFLRLSAQKLPEQKSVHDRRQALSLYLALENFAAFLQRLASWQKATCPGDSRVRLDHGQVFVTFQDEGEQNFGEAAVADS